MAKVVGIGGVFIRARDADVLRRWYTNVLGIEIDGGSGATFASAPESIVAFSIFDRDSTYIGDPNRQTAMINFVVDDLNAMVAALEAHGVPTEPIQTEPYGKFTWIADPESNRIELWEPGGSD